MFKARGVLNINESEKADCTRFCRFTVSHSLHKMNQIQTYFSDII